MNRIFVLSLLVVLFNVLPIVEAQENQKTTWKGTLDVNGTKLRLEVDITDTEKPTGELRSLDQNNATIKLAKIKLNDDEMSFSVPQIGATFSGKYSDDGDVAEGVFAQSGMKLPLKLERSSSKAAAPVKKKPKETFKEAWVGVLEMGIVKPVMQFRIVTLESGKTAAYFDSVTEGRTDFEATWTDDDGTLRFEVADINLEFEGELNAAGDSAVGTWSQGGRSVDLTLKKQLTPYDSKNKWENRPQKPIGPFPYDSLDVKFENKADTLTLAGTLTIPKKPGKHPAIVLISGSGPQDRDESLMEHKPFLVLADYLSRRGIAVLRYDDRGTAESTGKFDGATTEAFARDASSAVEFLKSHDRINASEIGLAGHSEGGLVAPMVVGLRDDVAFVVLLAATGVDGVEIINSQSQAMARAAGADESELEIAKMINRRLLKLIVDSKPDDDISDAIEKTISEVVATIPESEQEEAEKNIRTAINNQKSTLQGKWMRYFLAYDPRPALTKIECPVLAITGSKDLQVLPDLNMPEIEKALTQAGNKDFEIEILDDLNHLFQECETGAIGEYATIQETFNPAALKKIGDWTIKHTTPMR